MIQGNDYVDDRPTIPNSWRNMTSMQVIKAELFGALPDIFSDWKDLQILDFSGGGITGNFPSSICGSFKLQELILSIDT